MLGCDSLAEEAEGADRGGAPRPPLPGRRLQAQAACSPLPFLTPQRSPRASSRKGVPTDPRPSSQAGRAGPGESAQGPCGSPESRTWPRPGPELPGGAAQPSLGLEVTLSDLVTKKLLFPAAFLKETLSFEAPTKDGILWVLGCRRVCDRWGRAVTPHRWVPPAARSFHDCRSPGARGSCSHTGLTQALLTQPQVGPSPRADRDVRR